MVQKIIILRLYIDMKQFSQWIIDEASYRNKRNCPYWGDGGSGVLPLAKNTGRILINQRGMGVNEGGTYGVFGGGIFLDRTNFTDIDELGASDYPKQHALEELREETGYSGPIQMKEVFVYKDNKVNQEGVSCNFYYWNYVGVCPVEFPVAPGSGHEWEEGGGSRWITLNELTTISPKHFGLESVLKNAGSKIKSMISQLGFKGNENYPTEVQRQVA
jgi:8-oxo-dGTP pyrophosphatase MutT (NUDIX family)